MVRASRTRPAGEVRRIALAAIALATLGVGGALALTLGARAAHASHSTEAFAGATWAGGSGARPLIVTSLRSGGEAALAGLHVGDAIADVDGRPHPSFRALTEQAARRGRRPLDLRVRRRGDLLTLALLCDRARGDDDGRPHPADRGR